MNRPMTAKYKGTCTACKGEILPGDKIYWSRGGGASHVNCQTAKYRNSQCTACGGSGLMWNNAPCRACDGTGQRKMQEASRTPPDANFPCSNYF
jgi:DnaJ-class molecular chaperone